MLDLPSLLIADDDRFMRETLGEVFAERGFTPLLAADGAEAVEILQQTKIHLLLTDYQMPRLTGIEAIQQARAIRHDLPCILMTAHLDQQVREEARRAQVFRALSKPFSHSVLTGAVRDAMRAAYGWESE